MFREKQRSSAVGIPCEKMTKVRILGGQLRSTVGIGTRLREELDTRWHTVDEYCMDEIFAMGRAEARRISTFERENLGFTSRFQS